MIKDLSLPCVKAHRTVLHVPVRGDRVERISERRSSISRIPSFLQTLYNSRDSVHPSSERATRIDIACSFVCGIARHWRRCISSSLCVLRSMARNWSLRLVIMSVCTTTGAPCPGSAPCGLRDRCMRTGCSPFDLSSLIGRSSRTQGLYQSFWTLNSYLVKFTTERVQADRSKRAICPWKGGEF